MNEFISSIAPLTPAAAGAVAPLQTDGAPALGGAGFGDWLVQGAEALNQKLASANAAAAQFALGSDVPPHQVVLALEEARLSFQLAMQVRARLLEGYQELMRMQL